MSSELGTEFGQEFGGKYGEGLSEWSEKLRGQEEVSDNLQTEWSVWMAHQLSQEATQHMAKKAIPKIKLAGFLVPAAPLVISMYLQIATSAGLGLLSFDLLRRLHERSRENDKQAVDQMVVRAPQTVAQIFDMIKDFFGGLIIRFNQRKGNLTGLRRWRVGGSPSRHARLDGQVKKDGESFSYKGDVIYGPRPAGGSPANWSNCSCYLEVQLKNGDWARMQ